MRPLHIRHLVLLLLSAALVLGLAGAGEEPSRAQPAESALPRVDITSARTIRDDPKVRARVPIADGGAVAYDGWAGVELRGQSSQRFAKKSYGFELRTRGARDATSACSACRSTTTGS